MTNMTPYAFHTAHDSPNCNPGVVKLPAQRCVLHWWGAPSGQDPWGIVAWLCNPAAQVSAHAVIWPSNVACLVPYSGRSWANGNDTANNTAITLECDPNRVDATIPTIVAYLADLVRQGVLHPQFTLTGHRDWYKTECPGAEDPMTDALLAQISVKLTQIYDLLSPGVEGVKEAGGAYLAIAAQPEPVDMAAITEAVARGVAAALTNTQGA